MGLNGCCRLADEVGRPNIDDRRRRLDHVDDADEVVRRRLHQDVVVDHDDEDAEVEARLSVDILS